MSYTNSTLVNYIKISPNKTSPRNHKIDTITIHCLPVDGTDVLTKNGWISLRDITVGEEIATCDVFRNIIFDKVQNVIPVHKEKVYCFPTGFMGTLQHRLLTKKQSEVKNENIKYTTTTVEEVLSRKTSSYIPNSGIYQTKGLDLSPNAIDFLCAVQADGNYQYNDSKNKIYYIRLRFWKPRKIDAFRKIVKSLKYEYVEKKIYGCEGYDYGIEFIVKDPIGISICEKYLSNKIFNYKLLEMNQEQAYHFSDCLTHWDGTYISKNTYTEKRYVSRIKQNIDVVMAVMAIHNVGSRLNNAEMLTFKEKTYRTMGRMENVKVKDMDVSCVSVPSGYILIRQNGRPTLVGNCMAGNLSVESCGNVFAPSSKKASSNYGIGSDGRIAMYVEEKDRSWASSNAANDNRAITIEVANDGGAPDWHVSDKALNSLINLIIDICKRNNIKELKWKADKSLIGQVDKQNMTVHRWFKNKACPGDYLYNKHSFIANEVNKKLKINTSQSNSPSPSNSVYRVRKSWTNASSQIGAYSSLENAKATCKNGYYVFDDKGNIVYPVQSNSSSTTSSNSGTYKVKLLEDLNIRQTPNGKIVQVNGAKKGLIYTIVKTQGTWGFLKSGAGWISVSSKYVKRV